MVDNPNQEAHGDASPSPKRKKRLVVIGVVAAVVVVGLARGFPLGEPIALPLAYQAIYQIGAVAVCAAVLWWAFVRCRGVISFALWSIALTFVIVGVLLLSSDSDGLASDGAAFVSLANTFSLGVLWYSSYELPRCALWLADPSE